MRLSTKQTSLGVSCGKPCVRCAWKAKSRAAFGPVDVRVSHGPVELCVWFGSIEQVSALPRKLRNKSVLLLVSHQPFIRSLPGPGGQRALNFKGSLPETWRPPAPPRALWVGCAFWLPSKSEVPSASLLVPLRGPWQRPWARKSDRKCQLTADIRPTGQPGGALCGAAPHTPQTPARRSLR